MTETPQQIAKYLREYREAARGMADANPAKAKQSAAQLRAAYAFLAKSANGQDAISSLLTEYSPHVRLLAAAHSLGWEAENARRVLQELAEGDGPQAFVAMWISAEASRGLHRTKYDICDRVLSLAALRRLITSRYILGKQGATISRDELIQLIQNNGLARCTEAVLSHLQDSIRLNTALQEEALAPGVSKLGGQPDLPPGTAWPLHQGRPMAFIAQVRLADIAPFDTQDLFPDSGLLSFFFYADDSLGDEYGVPSRTRVLFITDEIDTVQPVAFPEALAEEYRYSPCAIIVSQEITLPQPSWNSEELGDLQLTEEEQERYCSLLNQASALQRNPEQEEVGGAHRMLGYPDYIQIDIFYDCPEPAGPEEWQLLLQVETDDQARMLWGDLGKLFFCIRRTDLARRDFSKVWSVLQGV